MTDEILLARQDRLRAFVDSVETKPVEWGIDDCTAFAAKWVEGETGESIELPKYSTRGQAARLTVEYGGLIEAWAYGLPSICTIVGEPLLGDIGIIPTERYGDAGVIFAHNGACIWRSEKSYRMFQPRYVKAIWRVPDMHAHLPSERPVIFG